MDDKIFREILDEIDSMTSEEYLDLFKKAEGLPDFPLYPKDIKAGYLSLALQIWKAEGCPDIWIFTIAGEHFAYTNDTGDRCKLIMIDKEKLREKTMRIEQISESVIDRLLPPPFFEWLADLCSEKKEG